MQVIVRVDNCSKILSLPDTNKFTLKVKSKEEEEESFVDFTDGFPN